MLSSTLVEGISWYDGLANVQVLTPGTATREVVDGIFRRQFDAEFAGSRQALLLTPGDYPSDFRIKVGYYTSVYGVGAKPSDVRLDSISSHNGANGHATNNFWRSFEGVSLYGPITTWAVSQGSPIRRSIIERDLQLSEAEGFSSGGFMSDMRVLGHLQMGSQQQWIFRNTNIQGQLSCPAGWNYVFVGVAVPSPATSAQCNGATQGKVTEVMTMARGAEKPYLVMEGSDSWKIYVPRYKEHAAGATADYAADVARKLDLETEVFVARPQHSPREIIAGIVGKRGLLLTPGVYFFAEPIRITTDGFVLLGLGYATVAALRGLPAIQVADGLSDVRIAGVLLEARTPKVTGKTAPLLQWGVSRGGSLPGGVASDVFARIGSFKYQGCPIVRADTMVEINSDGVVLDNVWLWHADHDDCGTDPEHGKYGKSDQCYSQHGLVVNGQGVTSYGLSVEHIVAGHNVVWNGEHGESYFFQAELPYHAEAFGRSGFSGYKVAAHIQAHKAFGLGVYIIGRQLQVRSAFLLPSTAQVRNLVCVVIHGHQDQFKSVACASRGGGTTLVAEEDQREQCFGPQSCKDIRCFLAEVPISSALSPRLPAGGQADIEDWPAALRKQTITEVPTSAAPPAVNTAPNSLVLQPVVPTGAAGTFTPQPAGPPVLGPNKESALPEPAGISHIQPQLRQEPSHIQPKLRSEPVSWIQPVSATPGGTIAPPPEVSATPGGTIAPPPEGTFNDDHADCHGAFAGSAECTTSNWPPSPLQIACTFFLFFGFCLVVAYKFYGELAQALGPVMDVVATLTDRRWSLELLTSALEHIGCDSCAYARYGNVESPHSPMARL